MTGKKPSYLAARRSGLILPGKELDPVDDVLLAAVAHAPARPGSGEDLQRFIEHLAAPPVIELLARRRQLAAETVTAQAGDGRVDIGTFQSVSNVISPPVVRRLREEHPGCDIRLFEEETDQPQVSDLDLMFFDGRVDGDVEHLKLLDDPYLLVARPGACPGGPVPLAGLDGAPMVAHPPYCS